MKLATEGTAMLCVFRQPWCRVVSAMSTRRALVGKLRAADAIGGLWSACLAAQFVLCAWFAIVRSSDPASTWFDALEVWATSGAAPALQALGVIYLWFWGWMALDAYGRDFGDSEVLSCRRCGWLGGLVLMPWLAGPIYWFAVKRKAVVTEIAAWSSRADARAHEDAR